MKQFKEKHVVVTGGAKGIGEACVTIFIREGAKVSILDIDSNNKLNRNNKTSFYHCDVSKEDHVAQAISEAILKFGEIDVLINNAGIQRYSSVTETSEKEWDLVMNVNLKGAFLCAKHAIPSMQRKGSGVVVNLSSVQAFVSQKSVAAYTTSKTAMLGLTRSIAVDYGPHIRCLAVCPGTVDTPMLQESIRESPNPQEVYQECIDMHIVKKIATAEEIGELVAYLTSDKASFITGQAFRIDGGLGISIGGSKRAD